MVSALKSNSKLKKYVAMIESTLLTILPALLLKVIAYSAFRWKQIKWPGIVMKKIIPQHFAGFITSS